MNDPKAIDLQPKTWWQRLRERSQRLQWRLTFAYALFTLVTILILAAVAMGFLWYGNFQSNRLPNLLARGLNEAALQIAPALDQSPPDVDGLNEWLDDVTRGRALSIVVSINESGEHGDEVPANFGNYHYVVIVDENGEVLATAQDEDLPETLTLAGQLTGETQDIFDRVLQGETEPEATSTRQGEFLVAAAPIFNEAEQIIGAILIKTTFPLEQAEFFVEVLQSLLLPAAAAMLIVGLLVGILFGYLISRGLTRRLKALGHVADDWSEGNFERLALDNSSDELGQLSRHLNHMAIQLQNLMQTRQELATLEERNRLARDLHDSVKQQVFATTMQVGAARALIDQNPADAKQHLAEAEQLVRQAQQELTVLIKELRPAALEGKGLVQALRDHIEDWARQTNIQMDIRVWGERPLPLPIEQTLFRVAQEALANIARHSDATTAEIHLAWEQETVLMSITDDGRGFDLSRVNGVGVGLQSMRERVEALGGKFSVESEPRRGTCVTARVVSKTKQPTQAITREKAPS